MHTMGTSFVGKVRDVWQIVEAQIGEEVANIVEFNPSSQYTPGQFTDHGKRGFTAQH